MTSGIEHCAALRDGASVATRMTDDLVARFVALTGDCSSLHVSDAFARRTAYRQPVAHGMLPIALLPLLPQFRVDGLHCTVAAIEARFLNPVFIGGVLRLTTSAATWQEGDPRPRVEFKLLPADGDVPITSGTMTLAYREQVPADARIGSGSDAGSGLLTETVSLDRVLLEEIERGQIDTLDFRITSRTIDAYLALLEAAGLPAGERARVARSFTATNLLSLLLFSTSVGVRRPGSTATFLEFAGTFSGDIQPETDYRLEAEVSHRSLSTRIIKKQMRIAGEDGAAIMTGRVSALVNKPAGRMPSAAELRPDALDWGLKDKVALVTGASRGIGETTAKLLALCGARVIVNFHRGSDDAERVVQEIVEQGGQAVAIRADVSSGADVAELVRAGLDRFGRIDVLVNNAGRDYRPVPFLRLTWDEIQKDLDVITKGAFLCAQAVIPSMLAQGGGKIINISTVATEVPPPDQAKYVIAKSALVGLTRSLAVEFAGKNIQVNMVSPSFVETDFVAHVPDGFRHKIAQDTPMRRLATPVDVARAVVMLASSYSSFTTGQQLLVTGGGTPYL